MNYATIKIKEEKDWKKNKIFCVDINYPYGHVTSFCEPTLKKLFKQIKETMYI